MRLLPTIVVVAIASLLAVAASAADTIGDCHIGAYRLADGSLVDIGPGHDDTLRWRMFDGTTGSLHPGANGVWTGTLGWTERGDGTTASFSDCGTGDIVFDKSPGHRVALDVTNETFAGDGVKLAGRLVLPPGHGRVPIVVLIHGSEDSSALDTFPLQRLLPAVGVGVFVYDKRGTGASEGKYTQDFDLLANDAVLALREARRLAGPRAGRVGYHGGSEGGWVAPLAASRTHADFVITAFGLATSILDEDREEMALEMALKGHTAAETAQALQIADAVGVIMVSKLTDGFAQFDAVRDRYRDKPWYKDVHGNFTWMLLPHTKAEIQAMASQLPLDAPFKYDPMPVLRRLKTPQLWIQGGDDLEAPAAETHRRLVGLQTLGAPIVIAVFPHAEHGIYEFETDANGERTDTRNSDGYFAMIRDFALSGQLRGDYGRSRVTEPPRRARPGPAAHGQPSE